MDACRPVNARSGRNDRSGRTGSSRKAIAIRDGFDNDDNDDERVQDGDDAQDDDDESDDEGGHDSTTKRSKHCRRLILAYLRHWLTCRYLGRCIFCCVKDADT